MQVKLVNAARLGSNVEAMSDQITIYSRMPPQAAVMPAQVAMGVAVVPPPSLGLPLKAAGQVSLDKGPTMLTANVDGRGAYCASLLPLPAVADDGGGDVDKSAAGASGSSSGGDDDCRKKLL